MDVFEATPIAVAFLYPKPTSDDCLDATRLLHRFVHSALKNTISVSVSRRTAWRLEPKGTVLNSKAYVLLTQEVSTGGFKIVTCWLEHSCVLARLLSFCDQHGVRHEEIAHHPCIR